MKIFYLSVSSSLLFDVFLVIFIYFLLSSAPDCGCYHRNRTNRTGVRIRVNDGMMGEPAAIASLHIGAKQEVKSVL